MYPYKRILPALFLTLLIACGGKAGPEFYEKQRVLMGTVFRVKVPASAVPGREEFSAAAEAALGEVARLESELSEWKEDSPIAAAAEAAGDKPVAITKDISEVVELALGISAGTGGAFDISFKPLGKLWRVKKRKEPPAAKEVEKARALVDHRAVELDKGGMTLFLKKKGMAVGLGAVAKGYAAGRAGAVLRKHGIKDFMVDAGGDLFYSGKAGGRSWTGGMRAPDGGLALRFRIKRDCAVVTSGDYENYFLYGGKRYHHIIDPATGYPAQGVRSVTVFSSDPAAADAYSTAFFVLGRERSLNTSVVKGGKAAFIMMGDGGDIFISPGVEDYAEVL